MKSTILCLSLLVVGHLVFVPLAFAKSPSDNRDESDSCTLQGPMMTKRVPSYVFPLLDFPKTRSLPLPQHLSFAQRNYLFELCKMLYERGSIRIDDAARINDNAIRLERKEPAATAYTTKELLTLEKDLLDLRLQNLNKLTEILEQAITTSAFNEEGFWKAWREEKRHHEEVDGPLRKKIFDLSRETEEKVDRLLKSAK